MVSLPDRNLTGDDGALLEEWFTEAYSNLFSRSIPNLGVEVLNWTLSLATDREGAEFVKDKTESYGPKPEATRRLFDPASGAWIEAGVYARADLPPGAEIAGPAVIVEDETTTLVTNGFGASVNALGQIVMTKGDAA
jgi:N-methylhydantoinase A